MYSFLPPSYLVYDLYKSLPISTNNKSQNKDSKERFTEVMLAFRQMGVCGTWNTWMMCLHWNLFTIMINRKERYQQLFMWLQISNALSSHSWHSVLHLCTRLSCRLKNNICKPHIGKKNSAWYQIVCRNVFPTVLFEISDSSEWW